MTYSKRAAKRAALQHLSPLSVPFLALGRLVIFLCFYPLVCHSNKVDWYVDIEAVAVAAKLHPSIGPRKYPLRDSTIPYSVGQRHGSSGFLPEKHTYGFIFYFR